MDWSQLEKKQNKHPFNNRFLRTTWVSRCPKLQKDKTIVDFDDARHDGVTVWQWHRLDHMQTTGTRQIIMPTSHRWTFGKLTSNNVIVSCSFFVLWAYYNCDTSTIRARFDYDSATTRYNTLRGFLCARIRDRIRESVVGVSCMLTDSSMHTAITVYLYRPTLHRVCEYARNCLYKGN